MQEKAAQGIALTAGYLTRKCKEVMPKWRLCPEVLRRAFSAGDKRKRLEYCVKAEHNPMDYWMSCVFGDEHTFFRKPIHLPTIHLAGLHHRSRTTKDPRRKVYSFGYPKMHFFYAVHWKLGVLGPYWLSDTAGFTRKRYPVSTRPPTPPCPTHLLHLLPLDSRHVATIVPNAGHAVAGGVGGGVDLEGDHVGLQRQVPCCQQR